MQGGEQEAREFLSTLINSKLAAKPTKLLLLLGESAQDWLLSAEQKNSVKDGLAPMNADVTALIAPALNQMLSQPQAKRLTWQAICQHFKHTSVTS
jgi:DNA polymerase III psi subunit